jgi:D-alanyl-D-alanine carboxypeptidase (penicillin-binding protein 5/6)
MTTQAPFPEGRSADGKQTPALSISNDNTLLLTYPGAIGIKNGYTNAAEFT